MARLTGEFEVSTKKRNKTDFRNHEQSKYAQMTFYLADSAVIDTLRQIKYLGQEQYDTNVNERLVNQTKLITDLIKRNNLPLSSRPPVRAKSRAQLQRSSLKNDCSLFSSLYVASQMDLHQFFQYENQAYPPALSQMGKLRTGTKSDLVGCLEDLVPVQDNSRTPVVQVQLSTCFDRVLQRHFLIMFLPHITSHRIASHRIASHRIASHRIASHRIASHRIASHRIASHRIASHHITQTCEQTKCCVG